MNLSSHHSQDTRQTENPHSKKPNPKAEVERGQKGQRLLLRMNSGLMCRTMAPSARRDALTVPSAETRYLLNRATVHSARARHLPQQGHGIPSRTRHLQQVTVHPQGGCGTLNRIGDSKHKRAAPQKFPRQGCYSKLDWGRTGSGVSTLRQSQ
jgi:hypothetical protein